MKKLFATTVLLLAAFALAACDDQSGAGRETRATQQLQNQAAVVVGMPGVVNFTEKRQLKAIYELRDNPKLATYTYTIDMNGRRHKVCPTTSFGFGIPYATQYTAPKAPHVTYPTWPDGSTGSAYSYNAEQPEPNGLYMPSQADGTWVLCLAPDGKSLAPTYVEPRVVVYTFEMPAQE